MNGIRPVNDQSTEVSTFTINSGESVKSIVSRLSDEKLISSPTVFFILIKLKGIEKNLQAGEFRLSKSMPADVIAEELMHGTKDTWITIIEGWRSEEVAAEVSHLFNIPESEFLKYAKEGYLFPDTYSIPRDATASALVDFFVSNFYKKVTPEMLQQLAKQKKSLDDTVILASIVEREGKSSADKPIIAGILINRLNNEIPLQADATLQYVLGYQPHEKTWWKKDLYNNDKDIDSKYNTYKYTGLPPKPISNPGLDSIKAVIYPQMTNYFYYLHDANGNIHYAVTLDEHNKNIQKYLVR